MSWPTPYPPPPRRSRSRSPSRASYPSRPPYSDPAYPESYRPEWDTYDRDRNWAAYERPPGSDNYGRRGRSRSPPPDESGRKRRRSMSPYDRERYDPRPRYSDDYDTHSRGYGHSPPRRGPPGPFPPSRRAPPDPHTFDYPATLKQYAEWFRYYYPQQAIEEDNADKAAEHEAGDGSKPRNGIKSRWEKYKKDFAASQLQTMFEHHRKSPWFAEKYDPAEEYQMLRMRVKKEGWKGRLNNFLHDLESGKFDPDLNEPESEPPSPVKENASNGDNAAEANGSTAPSVSEEKKTTTAGDDDMQFGAEADEEAGENDLGRTETNGKNFMSDKKRDNRGEEVSVAPEGNQVMIRTIPPDIGRVKLEEACAKIPGFSYLALGDPLQKRNYYRAGWIRFRDDADMSAVMAELTEKKIEGFKLHVTHNQRPFVNRIRYAPEVASRPERLEKDLANAKTLATILEDEASKLRATKVAPVVPKAEPSEGAKETEDAAMAPPDQEEEEEEPKMRGSDAVEQRIEKIMSEMRDQGLIDLNDEKAYAAKKTVIALDMYLAYLRAAFHACYYCSIVTDHLEELQRKCIKHERKPLSKMLLDELKAEAEKEKKGQDDDEEKEDVEENKEKEKPSRRDGQGRNETRDWKRNDERWLEWLDSKIALLINRDGVDPRDYGGKSYEDELTKAVEPYIKQEDEGKFRCKTCQKLFKATSFVEKHIANKHPELVKQLDELQYFNNFALDPHRIQPFAHPPQMVGNASQAPPPQAYGIQGQPSQYGGDYGRNAQYYGGGGGPYPPGGYPPPYNGYWEHPPYPGGYGPPGSFPPPPRRDEITGARRLSERLGGFVSSEATTVPVGAGLPPKPSPAALDTALSSGNGAAPPRRNNRNIGGHGGPPPPPPPDAKEDPRAAAGKRVSYHDMDLVAEGDVELFY